MPNGFLPTADAKLLAFVNHFTQKITGSFATYGISPDQAEALGELSLAFQTALQTATNPDTRTRGTIAAKDDARRAVVADIRNLVSVVRGQGLTDQQLIDLGLPVRAKPTPVPPPAHQPGLDVVAVNGRTVTVKLHDTATAGKRGRPKNTTGATLYTYVGGVGANATAAPADVAQWSLHGLTSQTTTDVTFPADVPPGAQVWVTAAWFNQRKETGPAAAPASAYIQYDMNLPTGKKAA